MELKLLEKMFGDAKEYIKKNDAIQSSEKLYKVAEECLKLLASKNGVAEYKEAKKEGRWWGGLLSRASAHLTKDLRESKIGEAWAIAYELHVWGFHEHKLDAEIVEQKLSYIEWLLKYTKAKTSN